MIWPATHGRWWRSGPACDIAIDGTRLHATRGRIRWDIDLAAPDAQVVFHHWGLSRGTVAAISDGKSILMVAGEGFSDGDLAYLAPAHRPIDLILGQADFAAMVKQIPPPLLRHDHAFRTFWFWRNGFRTSNALRPLTYVVPLIVASGLAAQLPSTPLAAAISVLLFAGMITIEIRRHRRTTRPTFRLVVAADSISLGYADSATAVGEWARQSVAVRQIRWRPPLSRGVPATVLDMPGVIIEGMPRTLSVGSSVVWSGTGGPKSSPPDFLVNPACWSAFATALLPTRLSPAPTHDSSDRSSRRS